MRSESLIRSSYLKGKLDSIKQISPELKKLFGTNFESENCEEIIAKIRRIYLNRENLEIVRNIECNLSDLYRLIQDTEKIIKLFEQGISAEGKLKLKKFKFNLKIKKEEILDAPKQDIASMFNFDLAEGADNQVAQYLSALKHESENLKKSEDFSMFIQCDLEHKASRERPKFTTSSLTSQEILLLRFNRQQKNILQEKEWETREIKIIKEKYKQKKKNLKLKKLEQIEAEKHLKKKNLNLEKEKAEVERLRESYHREKKKIQSNYENKMRRLSDFIDDLTVSVGDSENTGRVSPITETDMLSDVSCVSDLDTSFDLNDIDPVQKRITDLENKYIAEKSPEAQEKLKKEIDSLKNNLTNIRSAQAIKNSNRHQKRFSFFKGPALDQSIKLSTVLTPRSKLSLASQRPIYKYSTTTPKSSSYFSFNDIFPSVAEEENELKKVLRIKEAKLEEREERFEKERESLLQRWGKLPDANKLIPIVQQEILEYKKKKEEFEKKMKEIDSKEVGLEMKEVEIKKRERELERKEKEVSEIKGKLNEDKSGIVFKLERLKEDLVNR